MKRLVGVVALVVILGAGCGGSGNGAAGHAHGDHVHGSPTAGFGFGEPADPSEADRTIEVVADVTNRFDPDELQIAVGETVTFSVRNEGSEHEFVLGDEAYHEGVSSGHQHGGNGVHLQPGDEAELTFTFLEPGSVRYACHVDNHYELGMFGTITVE